MVFSAVVHERREGYDIGRHVGSRHQDVNPVLQCVAVSCSVLQYVAMCCSVLQCVAVCCSVIQYRASHLQQASCCKSCVAVCCSVLQCVV